MLIKDTEIKRTPWLNFAIITNIMEIIFVGSISFISFIQGDIVGGIIFGLAVTLLFFTFELMQYTTRGRDGCIIIYLILGFSFVNVTSILFALQLYAIAFNEPTIDLLKQNRKTDKMGQ